MKLLYGALIGALAFGLAGYIRSRRREAAELRDMRHRIDSHLSARGDDPLIDGMAPHLREYIVAGKMSETQSHRVRIHARATVTWALVGAIPGVALAWVFAP